MGIGHSTAFVIIMVVCETEEVEIFKETWRDMLSCACSVVVVIMQAFKSYSGKTTC